MSFQRILAPIGACLVVATSLFGQLGWTGSITGTNVSILSGTLQLGTNGNLTAALPIALTPAAAAIANLDLHGGSLSIRSLTLGGSGTSSIILNGGTLTLAGTVTFDASASPPAHAAGLGTFSDTGTIVIGGDRTFDVGSSSVAEGATNNADLTIGVALSGAGNVTKTGAGVLQFDGAANYTGDTIITGGRLRLGSGALPAGTNVRIAAQSGYAVLDLAGKATTIGSLTFGGVNGATSTVDLAGGTLTLGGDVRYDATNSPGTADIRNGGSLALGSAARTFTVDDAASTSPDLWIAAPISGSVGLIKAGAGTLLLTGNNSYTGNTIVTAGTLQLGHGAAAGSVAGDIQDDAAVVFDQTTNPTYAGTISGTGTVGVTGQLTLSGANTYAGGTTVNGGSTLTVANTSGSGTGTGPIALLAGGTLAVGDGGANGAVGGDISGVGSVRVNQSSDTTYGHVISGSVSLTKSGNGTLTLANANTFSGATTIESGTLKTTVTGAIPSGSALNLQSNGTLEVGAATTLQRFSNSVDGTIVIDPAVTLRLVSLNGLDLGAVINGAGNSTLVLSAPNSVIAFSGADTVGSMIVDGGTVHVYGTLSPTGSLVLKAASTNFATLDLNSTSQSIGSLYFGGGNSVAGGASTVQMSGGTLTLGAMVGFVALFGMAARNTILLVSHYDHLVAVEGETWSLTTALRGAEERLTPVLLTALLTALALLPVALQAHQPGHEIEGPMAIVILGGLVSSTLVSLLLIPPLAARWLQPGRESAS